MNALHIPLQTVRAAATSPMARRLCTLLLVFALSGCGPLRDAYLDYKLADRTDHSFVTDKQSLRVLTCGTGSPQGNTGRAQACTLVAAGGLLFLFDAGEGAAENLERFHVPLKDLSRVFITHWHSDHFNGLGALINQGWIWGRRTPVSIYGPPGAQAYAQGINTAYAKDVEFRHADFVPEPGNAQAQTHEVSLPPGKNEMRVFEQGGVTIDVQRVLHEPVEPAYGYVIRFRGKKVFISGDTRVDAIYQSAMQDADLVVHEAISVGLVQQAADALRRNGRTQDADVADRVIHYHADTLALARMAQQANVKHLVLTHLIPAPADFIGRHLFVRGMADLYSGRLDIAEDGYEVRL